MAAVAHCPKLPKTRAGARLHGSAALERWRQGPWPTLHRRQRNERSVCRCVPWLVGEALPGGVFAIFGRVGFHVQGNGDAGANHGEQGEVMQMPGNRGKLGRCLHQARAPSPALAPGHFAQAASSRMRPARRHSTAMRGARSDRPFNARLRLAAFARSCRPWRRPTAGCEPQEPPQKTTSCVRRA